MIKKIKPRFSKHNADNHLDEDGKILHSKKIVTGFELFVISFMLLIFGIVCGCFITLYTKSVLGYRTDGKESEIIKNYNYIKDNYYGKLDENKLLNSAISGMLESLGDDYSSFYDEESTLDFNSKMDGKYKGIGASIQWDKGENKVVEVHADSPAEKAGIKVKDVIIAVGDIDVTNLTATELADIILKQGDSKFDITVDRNGQKLKFTLKLDMIELKSVHSMVSQENDKKIGYIKIDVFASNTSEQFHKELESLEKKKIDSLIIDVRDNTGGHLSVAGDILDFFFQKGTTLYQLSNESGVSKYKAKTAEKRNYPIVILVNEASASASELLTSCFMDNYKDVTVVGKTTYGKGTVQKAITLPNGSSYKLTVEKWLTSSGRSVDGEGVTPDVDIDIDAEKCEDTQLEKAYAILSNK